LISQAFAYDASTGLGLGGNGTSVVCISHVVLHESITSVTESRMPLSDRYSWKIK